MKTTCPAPDSLQSYFAQGGDGAALKEVERHVDECAACQGELDKISSGASLRVSLLPPLPASFHSEAGLKRVLQNWRSHIEEEGLSLRAASPSPKRELNLDFLAPAESADELGRLGGYRVLKVLGAGGMGIVFLAEDLRLKRPVALKVMQPSMAADPQGRQRFLREAQSAAALRHDNVVTIYQVGEDRRVPFLAMELLHGESLEDRLNQAPALTQSEWIRIAKETALGLAAAQDKGLIHRDIKPANLFLERIKEEGGRMKEGLNAHSVSSFRVKILDFGLARSLEDDTQITTARTIPGTPAYMSPEQAVGDPVDPRCDLFSLGCVLYRMCAGQVPFHGRTVMATLQALGSQMPKPPRDMNPDVPGALNDLILKLLAKEPSQRPESATAVAETLARLETTCEQADGKTDRLPLTPVRRPSTPRRRLAVAAACFALCLLAGGIIVIIRDREGKEIARIKVPPGGSVETVKDDRGTSVPAKPELVHKLGGHESMIVDVKFLPDSRRAVSIGADGTVRLWDAITGKELHKFPFPEGGPKVVSCMAVSPDGRTLAVGAGGRQILTWEIDSAKELHVYIVPNPGVSSIAFSPDGATLIANAGNADKSFKTFLCKVGEKKPIREYVAAAKSVSHPRRLEFLPDGNSFLTVEKDTIVRWRIEDAKQVQRFQGHEQRSFYFLLHPDGKRLISAGRENNIIVWDLAKGTVLKELKRGFSGNARSLALHPDGRHLLTTYVGGKELRIWDLETGDEKYHVKEDTHCLICLDVSPDGRYAIAGGGSKHDPTQDNKWVWVPTGDYGLRVYRLPLLASVPPGGSVETVKDNAIKDAAGAASNLELLHKLEGHEGLIRQVAFLPDSRRALSVAFDGSVRLWDVIAGKELRKFLIPENLGKNVNCVALSPDGRTLAAGSSAFRLLTWDFDSGKELDAYLVSGYPSLNGAAFSPDGKYLLANATDHKSGCTVILWKVGDTKPVRQFLLGEEQANPPALAFAPDGRSFFAIHKGAIVRWKIDEDKPYQRFEADLTQVNDFVLHPDGERLITAGRDAKVLFWDLDKATILQELKSFLPPVRSLAIHPGGRHLVACYQPHKNLRLWDLQTGITMDHLREKTGCFWRICLSPDGRYALTGGGGYTDPKLGFQIVPDGDNALRVYRLPFEKIN